MKRAHSQIIATATTGSAVPEGVRIAEPPPSRLCVGEVDGAYPFETEVKTIYRHRPATDEVGTQTEQVAAGPTLVGPPAQVDAPDSISAQEMADVTGWHEHQGAVVQRVSATRSPVVRASRDRAGAGRCASSLWGPRIKLRASANSAYSAAEPSSEVRDILLFFG